MRQRALLPGIFYIGALPCLTTKPERDPTMSPTAEAAFLLRTRGTSRDLEAFVVAGRFSQDGRTAGFALGDGTVRLMRVGTSEDWTSATVHDGAVLGFAMDPGGDGFVSGGDDGKLRRVGAGGSVADIGDFGMKWVEQVATCALDKGKGLIAAGAGKLVRLFDQAGKPLKELVHPSTVTG